MITFRNDTELTLVTDFDEKTDTITGDEVILCKANELIDADIVSLAGDFVDLQFGYKGGVAFGVQRACFDVVTN